MATHEVEIADPLFFSQIFNVVVGISEHVVIDVDPRKGWHFQVVDGAATHVLDVTLECGFFSKFNAEHPQALIMQCKHWKAIHKLLDSTVRFGLRKTSQDSVLIRIWNETTERAWDVPLCDPQSVHVPEAIPVDTFVDPEQPVHVELRSGVLKHELNVLETLSVSDMHFETRENSLEIIGTSSEKETGNAQSVSSRLTNVTVHKSGKTEKVRLHYLKAVQSLCDFSDVIGLAFTSLGPLLFQIETVAQETVSILALVTVEAS